MKTLFIIFITLISYSGILWADSELMKDIGADLKIITKTEVTFPPKVRTLFFQNGEIVKSYSLLKPFCFLELNPLIIDDNQTVILKPGHNVHSKRVVDVSTFYSVELRHTHLLRFTCFTRLFPVKGNAYYPTGKDFTLELFREVLGDYFQVVVIPLESVPPLIFEADQD